MRKNEEKALKNLEDRFMEIVTHIREGSYDIHDVAFEIFQLEVGTSDALEDEEGIAACIERYAYD